MNVQEKQVMGEVIEFKRGRAGYPKSEATVRPYHLWNANLKKAVRYRYYSDKKRAHNGALLECKWSGKVGTVIEVYNAHTGKLLGQYKLVIGAKPGSMSIEFYA